MSLSKVLTEPLIVQFDLNQIDTINGGSMYVHTENGKFINNYRGGVIFPNDKITYKTDLISNRDDSIIVNATIKMIQGGKDIITPMKINNLSLTKKEQTEKISQEFFAGGEGRTEIIIEYQILNSTTNQQIDLARLTGEIEVLSLSNKLQSDQYYTVLVGVIASSLIGVGTLTALYFNQKTSNRQISKMDDQISKMGTQNELLEKQIELLKTQNDDLKEQQSIQNRPWISLTDESPKHKFGKNHVKILFRNYGKTPAIHLEMRGAISTTREFTPEFLAPVPYSQNLSIAPNETFGCKIPLTDEEVKAGNEGNGLNFAVQLRYTYEKNKKGITTLTGNINNAILQGIEYDVKELE